MSAESATEQTKEQRSKQVMEGRLRDMEAASKAAVTEADARTRLAQEECKLALKEQRQLLHQ